MPLAHRQLHMARGESLSMKDDADYEHLGPRAPSPGIAAVLSVLIPGLGHLYCGRLVSAGLWFLGTGFSYWAFFVPGFLVHALCIYFAYQAAKDWEGY
jgi:hypothetical protein